MVQYKARLLLGLILASLAVAFVSVTFAPSRAQARSYTAYCEWKNNANPLLVRSGPGTSYSSLGSFAQGRLIDTYENDNGTCEETNGFYPVATGSYAGTGWVNSAYLTYEGSVPS